MEWITKHLIVFIETHELTAVVLFGFLSLSALYGISIFLRNLMGYRLSNEDLKEKRLENIRRLHNAQDAHDARSKENNLHISNFVTAFSEGAEKEKLNSLREKTISFYTEKYLASLEKYLDIFDIYHKRKKRRQFVEKVLKKELLVAVEFKETVNCEAILEILGRAKLRLDKSSYERVWQFWQRSLTPFSWQLRKELKSQQSKWPDTAGLE